MDPKKTTCMLYLQADHTFYNHYKSEEACIEVMTRHVQRVNSIYRYTGEFHFIIMKFVVHTCVIDHLCLKYDTSLMTGEVIYNLIQLKH